jgi:hypothetical protein
MKIRCAVAAAVVVAASVVVGGAAATAGASVYGSVATYSSSVSCKSSPNLGFASVGLNSPTIYHSTGFYHQRVEWYAVLYKITASGPVVANIDHRAGTIDGSGYFTNPIVWSSDSNGLRLSGTFVVRSIVYWEDAYGRVVDADDVYFNPCKF